MSADRQRQAVHRPVRQARPAEVLFERICRKNDIRQLLTKPYSPTTIGKVERWHQTLQTDFLNDACPFASVEEAQAAVDAWREEYNQDRPHQSLDMATPPCGSSTSMAS